MGEKYSVLRCTRENEYKEPEMICIICNNKIIDFHYAQCINCNSLSHINCQANLYIKNKCKKCKSRLKICSNKNIYK